MGRKSKEQIEREAAESRARQQDAVANEPGPESVGEDSGPEGGPPRIDLDTLGTVDDELSADVPEAVQNGSQDATGASGDRDPIDDRPTLSRDVLAGDIPTGTPVPPEATGRDEQPPESGTAVPPEPKADRPRRFKVLRGVVGSFTPAHGEIDRANFPVDDARLKSFADDGLLIEVDPS